MQWEKCLANCFSRQTKKYSLVQRDKPERQITSGLSLLLPYISTTQEKKMVKTNVITGFLGSGKTTTIRSLLAQKPANEKWALLINEFGEIGIDGALLSDSGAVIKEIPGGCLCCVNGLPMQVGLNMLLQQTRPDRLLIEPTGLGHPQQILSMLRAPVYASWLTLGATLCLLDARQFADPRIAEHQNFHDQLACADIIIANKADKYQHSDISALEQWKTDNAGQRPVILASQGNIPGELLNHAALKITENSQHHKQHAHPQTSHGFERLTLSAAQRWRRALNQGEGYFSCGWVFDSETLFDTARFLDWLRQLPVDRVKAVIRIQEGTLRVNRQGEDLSIDTLPIPPLDSRIELISSLNNEWNSIQSTLMKTRASQ
jgi:G3E family GTPase